MTRSSSALAPALAAMLLVAAPAAAQPGTADAARALYVEGKELRRAGDLQRSLEKFEAAHALYATPITALEVGRGAALVGRFRRAIEVLESIDRLPVKPTESAKASAARAEAQPLLAQYRTRLGRLTVRVEGEGARVRIDGDVVQGEAPWSVDPGLHRIEAERGDVRVGDEVRIGEGEARTVSLHLPAAPAPVPPPGVAAAELHVPAPPPVAPTTQPSPAEMPTRRTSPLAYAGFGVAGVGLVAGTVTGVLTLTRAVALRNDCRNGECLPSADLGTTRALGDVSTASFIIAGAGLAVGVGALIWGGKPASTTEHARIEPWIAGPAAGLRGVF
jgi:hypothetical protein